MNVPRPPALEVDETCTVNVDVPTRARIGDAVMATLRIDTKPPFHVTQDQPVSVYMVGTELVIPREVELAKDQVQVNDASVVARAPFRVDQSGTHRFLAEARFSVCNGERCQPVTIQRSWSLRVYD